MAHAAGPCSRTGYVWRASGTSSITCRYAPSPVERIYTRLSPIDVHDAGSRHRRSEPVQRVAGTGAGRAVSKVERKAIEEGDRVRTAAVPASTLAHRRFLHQHQRHV